MSQKKAAGAVFSGPKFASSIVNPYSGKKSITSRVLNRIFTNYYLSSINSSFIDFEKKEFPSVATTMYNEFSKAYRKRSKGELYKYLTPPNYEIVNYCNKQNMSLPFQVYPEVSKVVITSAFISSEQGDGIDLNNFAQITMKAHSKDSEGQEKTQTLVFERRLDKKTADSWRIALIEDN